MRVRTISFAAVMVVASLSSMAHADEPDCDCARKRETLPTALLGDPGPLVTAPAKIDAPAIVPVIDLGPTLPVTEAPVTPARAMEPAPVRSNPWIRPVPDSVYVAGGITLAALAAGAATGAASANYRPDSSGDTTNFRPVLTWTSVGFLATGGVAAIVTTVLYGSRPAKLRATEMANAGGIAF